VTQASQAPVPADPIDHGEELRVALRAVRRNYDKLSRGARARLRRCSSAEELRLLGAFYQVADGLQREQPHLHHVVYLFAFAEQLPKLPAHWSFGVFLRRRIADSPTGRHRFERLLAANSRRELDRHCRELLRQCCATSGARVEWGALGQDVLWYFAQSDRVRVKWAQGFFAPLASPVEIEPLQP
jgi:CRISPR type I-E-associated protein CasB/Cse2